MKPPHIPVSELIGKFDQAMMIIACLVDNGLHLILAKWCKSFVKSMNSHIKNKGDIYENFDIIIIL